MVTEIDTMRIGDLRVRVVLDEYAEDPRLNDNIAVIRGKHRRYTIGDGEPPVDEQDALDRGGLKLLFRYLAVAKGAIAIKKVCMLDHSSVHFYTRALDESSQYDDSLYGQFDSGMVGYAYVTAARCEELGVSPLDASRALDAEVEEYDQWANGEVYSYIVDRPHCDDEDCPHSEVIDSCSGFIGDVKYAMTEGIAVAKAEIEGYTK